VYIASKKTVVVQVPKCASSSLEFAIKAHHSVSDVGGHFTLQQHQQKNPEMKLGVALMREPLDRLRSGVEYCLSDIEERDVFTVRDNLIKSLREERPLSPSLVLYPQYSFLLCDVPARLYRLSSIDLLLGDLGVPGPAPVKNKTKKSLRLDQVIDVFGEDFVRQFYAIDFALYDSLCSTQGGLLEVTSAKKYILALREGCS
jgi:hypothetical protein